MKFHFSRFILSLAILGVRGVQADGDDKKNVCLESLTGITGGTTTCTPLGVAPMIEGASFFPEAIVKDQGSKDIFGCCNRNSDEEESSLTPTQIGKMPQFSTETSMQVLAAAKKAWANGRGVWPQMSLQERIEAIEAFLTALQDQRSSIINLLMWEIGKNYGDAEAEFDRTVAFARKVIESIQTDPEFAGVWQTIGSTKALVRRTAIGIILALGPYNYPLNETYATIIPALLMGNIVVLKIPTVGGLVHFLTMEAFKVLPEGTVSFISGGGRATMPPIMATGDIDGLAFIGGSNAADDLIKQHPHPHRLKVFLQLEANNMAIYLPDIFERKHKKVLENALSETITGTLSYNGQRCTALKLLFVPKAHGDSFTKAFVQKVEAMRVGLPWQQFEDEKFSQVTPLPSAKRVQYMKELIADALEKGASIMNKDGGTLVGGDDSTLMVPAVLYPVDSSMKVYHEEQFGPVIPIAPYEEFETVLAFGQDGPYAQQVSLFTAKDAETASTVIDRFSAVFGKINLGSQCGRSPDTLPFSGRRSSAMGVMSVSHALREFSVPTVVAYKEKKDVPTEELVKKVSKTSKFLQSVTAKS
ncbi:N-succinylglutamate 5-semialdehyde dehydrogenase [Seminavis robusta]|uniref:NADP-dependent glyceraldehyde-3-phosphate dehydrogenase n=1 Tax=Seminavis robusta TaxID=568900 RepID=A0A9N8EPF8_9STRA|nr:N-succinylglutamate 5-semialdehyde dehydrogenase [Seminavis robusta]|eukprot:Sro1595_g284710.1 N-succinylglutamate 5-semialdehyde dehydrogenase (587) ;mRNA; r:21036-23481